MRYTRAALGLLNAQYRSVLKKCFLINMGLFALGTSVGISPAVAIDKDDGRDSLPTTGAPYYLEWYETDKSNNRAIAIQWNPDDQIRYYSWRMDNIAPDAPYIVSAFSRYYPEGGATYNNDAIEDNRVSYSGKYEYFYIGNSADNGGAIYNDTEGSYKILDSNFIGNHAEYEGGAIYNGGKIDSLEGYFAGNYAINEGGGAIYNGGEIDSINGYFYNNYVKTDSNDSVFGGAISGDIGTISGIFEMNFAKSTSAADTWMDAAGGAISGYVDEIKGTFNNNYAEAISENETRDSNWKYMGESRARGGAIFFGHNKISGTFISNYAKAWAWGDANADGGAIYSNAKEIRGHFESNKVDAIANADDCSWGCSYARGGAIFVENGSNPIISGKFINNSARASTYAQGGAIYLESGELTIDGASEFTDNYISGSVFVNGKDTGSGRNSNAIHNSAIESEAEDGIVNFNSGNILINDGLSGENQKDDDDVVYKAIFNFNGQVTETSDNDVVTLNNIITNASTSEGLGNIEVNLNQGTLKLGHYDSKLFNKKFVGSLDAGVDFNVTGGKLTTQDGETNTHNLGNLKLNTNLNTAIDVDLNAKTGDKLTGSTAATTVNGSKILIDNIKIINDGNNNIIKVQVADSNIKDVVGLANDVSVEMVNGSLDSYLVVYENTSGNLKFGKKGTLETAVQFGEGEKVFTSNVEILTKDDLGVLLGNSLSINGNGHTIDGQNNGGMSIANGQTVNMNDVSVKGFNGVFAENNGTMNIAASAGNELNLNSGITNNGKLNITGAGKTNINSAINGSGIINAKGDGNLNVDGMIENALNLENGTLRLGNNGGVAKLIANGGSLTTQDEAINTHKLGQLDLQKDLNTSIDVDLSTKSGDMLTGSTAAVSADGNKILIDNIKVLNDGTNHIVKIEVADKNLKDVMSLADNVDVKLDDNDLNSYLIVYEKDDSSGNLKFGQVDALETAVQFENANKAFAMGSDIATDTDLGALTGESLSISGNGHTIDGKGFGGMTIADNQTVSLNDATVEGFNGVFAENNGTMNIAASAGNELNLNSGISGSGTVNANGEGKLNINSDIVAGKMNLSGGELNLKNGTELAKVDNFVADGGVLNVGDQTIKLKNAEFNDGSTVAINVKSDGNGLLKADSLTVNGGSLKATLGQGIVDMQNKQKTVTLLESGTAFTDNFADVADNNMYRFEKAEKAGDYIISLAKTAEEVSQENGGTQNNANTAKGWVDGSKFEQGSVSADVADKLADLAQNDAAGFNEALTALAPSDNPEVRTNSVNNNTEMFKAVVTHLDDGYQRARNGLASGDGSSFDGVSVWAKAFGNHAKVDDTAKAYGFKSDGYGATFGIEKQLTSAVKAGLGYSYFYNDVEGFNRDSDVNTHTGFVYGEYRPNNWYVNAIASYGYSDYNETKHVAGSKYKADYDVDNIGAQVLTGYNASVAKVDVTPEAGLRYNNIHRDNYVDGAGQAVKAETMDVMTAVAGVKVGKDLVSCFGSHSFYWRPEARLAATYDLISDKENAVVSLSNGSGYIVKGQRLNRFGVEAGAGVTFYLTPDVESSIGYEGKFRSHYQDHTGYVSAKYKF